MKMSKMPETLKFGGKVYRRKEYVAMKSEANDLVRSLRNRGISARIVAQRGYGGGWNIYTRKR